MAFIHKAFMRLRTVFCLFLCLCLPFTVYAQNPQYKIEGVEVDVTAENAVMAREKAFEEAQIKAFKELAARLLDEQTLSTFAMPNVNVISGYVQDFEVTNEQLSSVRYRGTYTFRFRPDAISYHMTKVDTPFSPTQMPMNGEVHDGRLPVLMLPYIQVGTATNIWDENNPFRHAWERATKNKGAMNITLPIGDILDIQQVYDDPALNYSSSQMNRLVARYEAREAMIAIAEKTADSGLDVSLYKTDKAVPFYLTTLEIPANPGYPEMQLYDAAVAKVQEFLNNSQKQQATIDPSQINMMKGRTAFSGIQEWLRLKRTLENVNGVQKVKVQGLKPQEAIIEVEYMGSEESFMNNLRHAGVTVQPPQGYQNTYNANLAGQTIYEIRLGSENTMYNQGDL